MNKDKFMSFFRKGGTEVIVCSEKLHTVLEENENSKKEIENLKRLLAKQADSLSALALKNEDLEDHIVELQDEVNGYKSSLMTANSKLADALKTVKVSKKTKEKLEIASALLAYKREQEEIDTLNRPIYVDL